MDLLEFLANFDWISPLIALTETAIHGHGWTFYLDLDSGWTKARCEKILRSKGVKVYGYYVASGDVCFQVPTQQAEWAECLLLRAGAPLKYALFSEKNRKYIGGDGGYQKVGVLASLMDFLASF